MTRAGSGGLQHRARGYALVRPELAGDRAVRRGRAAAGSRATPAGSTGERESGMRTVPALGEHTEALLRAAGMTDEQRAALRRDGVIA